MKVLGWDNGIHFGTIRGYGDIMFAVNPEQYLDEKVYPLAKSFEDFLGLLLATGHTAVIEQIVSFTKEQYDAYIKEEDLFSNAERVTLLARIREELDITPIDDPYAYVKDLQQNFDRHKIAYTDEYYDTLGLEPPTKRKCAKKEARTDDFFEIAEVRIARKKDES